MHYFTETPAAAAGDSRATEEEEKKLHHWRLLSQLKIDHIVFGTQATTFSAQGCEDFFYANFLFLPEVTVVLVGSDQGSSTNNHITEL